MAYLALLFLHFENPLISVFLHLQRLHHISSQQRLIRLSPHIGFRPGSHSDGEIESQGSFNLHFSGS